MKIFISYKFTGKKFEEVEKLITPVKELLEAQGHETYCNLFDAEVRAKTNFEAGDYVFYALEKMNSCDHVLVLLDSSEKSEGMLLEVGYAIAKSINITICQKDTVQNSYLSQMGTSSCVWDDITGLIAELQKRF